MKKKDLITLLAGVAVIVFLAVFFMRGDQLQHLIQTIERGTPVFLLAGLVFQLGKYFTQGLSFTWCFKAAEPLWMEPMTKSSPGSEMIRSAMEKSSGALPTSMPKPKKSWSPQSFCA